jgi:hypothetical protein
VTRRADAQEDLRVQGDFSTRSSSAHGDRCVARLRQLLDGIGPAFDDEPGRALDQALRGVRQIARELLPELCGEEPGERPLPQLLERLAASDRLPRRIGVHLRTVQGFATAADSAPGELDRRDLLPCLHSLDLTVRWYLGEHLGTEARIPVLPSNGKPATGETAAGETALAEADDEVTDDTVDDDSDPDLASTPFSTATGRPARGVRGLRRRLRRRRWLLPAALSILVVGLFLVQLWESQLAADRRFGYQMEETPGGLRVTGLLPGGPGALGGIAEGDLLVAVDGRPVATSSEYDALAADFVRGRPITLGLRRGGEAVELRVAPGMPVDWLELVTTGLVMLFCLGLAGAVLHRGPGDLRERLVGVFLFLLALELAIPSTFLADPLLGRLAGAFFFLLTGAQISVGLHLASVIPERQRWLAGRRWVILAYYAGGLGLGGLIALTHLAEEVAGWRLPWSHRQLDFLIDPVALLLWATASLMLLGAPALHHPDRLGRLQARLVLLGFLPWSLYVFALTGLELAGRSAPIWIGTLLPFLTLSFPVSIWAMMELEARHQRRILLGVPREIRRLDSVEEISALIVRDLELAFRPVTSYVFFQKTRTEELTLGHSSGAPDDVRGVPEHFELLTVAEASDEPLLYPEELASLPSVERRWLERLAVRVVAPLADSRHGLLGLLLLGPKRSEECYSDRDLGLLHALAGQIAMSFENIGLHTLLHQGRRVQREVLARLAGQDVNLVKECPSCGRCFDSREERCDRDHTELELSVPVERVIADRYRLDKVLGKGGIGAVYKGLDLRLDRKVAVKVLLGSVLDKAHVERRFEREARVVAQLNHPNVVTVYDFGQTAVGNTFIVLEYLRGVTLRSVLRRQGALDPTTVAGWLDPILEGLAAAHRKGVVHRDLKPGNVLIVKKSRGPMTVKLLDFGIAKVKSSQRETPPHLTVPGVVLGTLGYMAPEQLLGDQVDERADIYSVGVLVLEALLGRRPFEGRTPMEVIGSVARTLAQLPGDSPAVAELAAVLGRCLEQDPEDRPASIRQLQRELIPALRACPMLPPPQMVDRRGDEPTLALTSAWEEPAEAPGDSAGDR